MAGVGLALLVLVGACQQDTSSVSFSASEADADFPSDLATTLMTAVDGLSSHGAQVSVVLADGASWTYWEGPEPADYYLADIGSVGKTFLAALALLLAEDEVLQMDDRLDSIAGFPAVSMRMLLHHTSGLASDGLDLPPVCSPGLCQSYSNAGYELAGSAIEVLSPLGYEREMRTRVFEAFDLTQSQFVHDIDEGATPAIGYSAEGTASAVEQADPGDFLSTARDVARFGHLLYTGQMLSEDGLAQMVDFTIPEVPLGGYNECEPYALGTVRFHTTELGESWGHGGTTSHFRSHMEYYPEHGIAVAVVVHEGGDSVWGHVSAVRGVLADYLGVGPYASVCDFDILAIGRRGEGLLTDRPGYDGQPAISPGGTVLASVSVFEDRQDIVLLDLESGESERIELEGFETTPRWHPLESILVYGSGEYLPVSAIHVIDLETLDVTVISEGPDPQMLPSFSPDGEQIVYIREVEGSYQLWVMDSDGASSHRVEGSQDGVYWPAWSPAGDRIVYTSGGVPYIIEADGGEPFRIPINQIRVVDNPSWGPGDDIWFTADGDIWSVDPDGSRLQRFTQSPQVEDLAVAGIDGTVYVQVQHLAD